MLHALIRFCSQLLCLAFVLMGIGCCVTETPWQVGPSASNWFYSYQHYVPSYPQSLHTTLPPGNLEPTPVADEIQPVSWSEASPSLPSWESVRCEAATHAVLGRLTEIERGLSAEFLCGSRAVSPNFQALQQELLALRTATLANQAADQALQLYWSGQEANTLTAVLQSSATEIQSMQSDLKTLQSKGFPIDREPGELDRKRLSIEEKHESLKQVLQQTEIGLRALGSPGFSWEGSSESLQTPPIPMNGDVVAMAWESHPELRTLQLMIHRLTPETLPVARLVLQQYEGSLGTAQPVDCRTTLVSKWKSLPVLGTFAGTSPASLREVEVRRIQLAELLSERENAIAAECETHLQTWRTAYDQWVSAEARVASWREQVSRLKKKQTVDESITGFDIAAARLGALEAQADAVRYLFACLQAQRQVWTAQGVIGADCGLPCHTGFGNVSRNEGFESVPTPIDSHRSTPDVIAPGPTLIPMSLRFEPTPENAHSPKPCRPVLRVRR